VFSWLSKNEEGSLCQGKSGDEVRSEGEMRLRPGRFLIAVSTVVLLLSSSILVADAVAVTPRPAWAVRSVASPTIFPPVQPVECSGSTVLCGDGYFVTVTNVGTVASSGNIVVVDKLPAGASVPSAFIVGKVVKAYADSPSPGAASEGQGARLSCSAPDTSVVVCEDSSPLPPGGVIAMHVSVEVPEQAGTALGPNDVEVKEEGGAEAPAAKGEGSSTQVSNERAGFGAQVLAGVFGPGGESDTQAGSHPTAILTSIAYNTFLHEERVNYEPFLPVAEPRMENVDLPLGLVGNARTAPKCTEAELSSEACPLDTRVGVLGVYQADGIHDHMINLYNIVPENGYPAQFGFDYIKTVTMLRPRVLPSSSGYVLSVGVPAVPTTEPVKPREVSTLFFGDPSLVDGVGSGGSGEAFATNPDDCAAGPLSAKLEINAWVEPNNWQYVEAPMFAASSTQGVTGCQSLRFAPELQARPVGPEESERDTPTGYEVELVMPHEQEGLTTPEDLAPADLKDAVVKLPEGVSVSPGAANGLVACQASGPEGIDLGSEDLVSDENKVQEGEEMGADGFVHPASGHCPEASQIGEVEVETPLLEAPLKGHVFVAAPSCGGAGQPACSPSSAQDGELFGLYLEIAGSGVIVKLELHTSVNPVTGQITASVSEAPQLPFSRMRMRLKGGQDAPLANPRSCGSHEVTSDMTPWSAPYTPVATSSSSFGIGGCANGFAPSFSAGMSQSLYAGTYSPFTTTFSRQDGEQDLSGVTVALPPGLLGKIAGIARCGETEVAVAEANTGTCPEASKLGAATAAAGAGSEPFWQSGNVYLTGPYDGAPFGLAIVVPANAGPYHLGNIVVRARIEINSSTAQVTVTSNPLPQMIDGVPLRIKTVNVTISREGFMFNATNCAHQQITGTITSAQGTQAGVSTGYAPSVCGSLPFKPVFSASTSGRTSKQDGASLSVKITKQAGEANIAKVDLTIPAQLPSRLTTLQKACTEAQFNANPAGCPPASDIATATVHTPLLGAPLTGPVFFVSHGGAAFPDVEMVLQAEGVRLIVDGHTQIKDGVTYSRFETVPDAPFTSFEFVAPQGQYSIFSANGSLCSPTKTERVKERVTVRRKGRTRKLTRTITKRVATALEMPTTITGQNGAVIAQNTRIAVVGCAKAVPVKGRAKKRSGGGRRS
jgi:hypothetical protein